MAALPYIQLYVADYLGDTYHLTTEEHGAYLLLIMTYWQSGKSIHKSRLASAARMTSERWTDVQRTLNEFFTEDENGYWIHDRIEDDLARVNAKSVQASRAGLASAAKRGAAKPIENKEELNGRSTDVQRKIQRTFNHTDTNTYTNTDTKKEKIKRFVPPKLDELKKYVSEKNYSFDPESFIAYYESKNWMIGKNKMSKWQSACVTWQKRINDDEKNKRNNSGTQSRAKRVSDKLDEIARRDIEENGFAETLDS